MIRLDHPASHPGVAVLSFDRPDKRNALTPDMLRDASEAAVRALGGSALRADRGASKTQEAVRRTAPPEHARALVLTGEGPVFCSGFDLSLCRDDSGAMGALLGALSAAIRTLRGLSIPVVAAAHGGAIAGGCALLCGADVILTDFNAKLGYPVTRLGVSPAVSAPTLRMLLGDGRTRERLLNPELIPGHEAMRLGLVHECLTDPKDVLPRALEIALSMAAKPAHAMLATKRWLNELDGSNDVATLDRALHISLSLADGPEQRERLAAMWK